MYHVDACPNASHAVFAECEWGGINGHANKVWGPKGQFKNNFKLRTLISELTLFAIGEKRMGKITGNSIILLVSALQTHSSQILVFNFLLSLSLSPYNI